MRDNVIIIGAGVAGLAAGCSLARRGVDVTILEANQDIGGCCGTTTVSGYTFHDGAVYIAMPRMLDSAFARLGLDRAGPVPLRKIAPMFSVTLPGSVTVTLREGLDVQVEGRTADRAQLQTELRRLMRKWEPLLDIATERLATEPFSAWRTLRYTWRHIPKFRGTVGSELRALITDEWARAALASALLHTGLPPDRMPVAQILGLVAVLGEGLFLPDGGMRAIPDALARALRQHGGEIRLRSPVTRIVVDEGRARAVEIAGAGRMEAATVISTLSPMATFTSLVGEAHVPRSMTARIAKARLSHRAVSLQFGLARRLEMRALMNMTLPMMESQDRVLAQDPRAIAWPVYSVPTQTVPDLAPPGGSVVEMFVPVAAESALAKWDDGERQAVADAAIRAIGCFDHRDVVAMRVRSPRDIRDQMHLYEGALYGLSPAVAPQQQFPQATPVRGLLLAGQCTFPGYGVAPAIMSGIFAADATIAAYRSPQVPRSGSDPPGR